MRNTHHRNIIHSCQLFDRASMFQAELELPLPRVRVLFIPIRSIIVWLPDIGLLEEDASLEFLALDFTDWRLP